MVRSAKTGSIEGRPWVPDRQDIIWINCNPQAGNEMRDLLPFLVLSPAIFNERTSLVIGLPMTTAKYNADNPFELQETRPDQEAARRFGPGRVGGLSG